MNPVTLRQYGQLLAGYLKPQWLRVALLACTLAATIGLQLFNPQVLRYFIDQATSGGPLSSLITAALLFLALAIVNQALSVLATYVGENVGWTATNMMRVDLTLHCLRLDMPFHKARTPGEMIERVDGDITAISTFFSKFVIHVLANLVLIIGVLILLYREDWRIGLAQTAFAILALYVLMRIRTVAVPAMAGERQASAELFGFIEERLAGLSDIRANGAGGHVMRGLYKAMRELYHRGRRAWAMDALLWICAIGVFTMGYVVAFAIGAYLFQQGAITLGTMYLFFQYTELIRQPLDDLTEQMKELQKATAGIARVQELYNLPIEIKDGPGVSFPAGALPVEFDSVSFGYGEDEMVIKDVSFQVQPGEVLGLLGRTGSGKTTLTRLLLRLYDPDKGAIRVGRADIRQARVEDLRRHIAMVTQDVQLFQGTVRDNLTLFDDNIPDEHTLAAIEEIGLGKWFAGLPNGLDTALGAGSGGLSAGEAQLLAFTRVFLKDPGLVILDEASSRLDPASEQMVERAVDRLLVGRTGIIVAHRLATVRRAGEILILEGGSIIEYGPRVELLCDPDSRFYSLSRAGLEEVLA